MNCPHCGAELLGPVYPISTARYDFACGTVHVPASSASPVRSPRCYGRQISQLKAELAQSVRRDDPRLKEVVNLIGEPGRSSEAKHILQSIIEGKHPSEPLT